MSLSGTAVLVSDHEEENQPLVTHNVPSTKVIVKELVNYAGPFVPGNLLINIGFTYTYSLLTKNGPDSLSVLAYVNPLNAVAEAASFTFFGTGTAASQAFGENNEWKIRIIGKQSLKIGAGLCVPIFAMYYSGPYIASTFGITSSVFKNIQAYTFAYGWSFAPISTIATFSQMSIPYGTGPTAMSLILSTSLTCALSYAFAEGKFGLPPMPYAGPALGSALATLFAATGFGLYLRFYPRYQGIWQEHAAEFNHEITKKILSLGMPTTINALSQIAGNFVGTLLISHYIGPMGTAQQGLVGLPNGYLQTFLACTADATTIVIAKHYGAREYRSLKRYLHAAIRLNLTCGLIGLGLISYASPYYIRYFAGPTMLAQPSFEPTVRNLILLSASAQVATSVGNLCVGSLRGIGETWHPMWMNIGVKVILNVALSCALAAWSNLGVYSPYVADMTVSLLLYSPLLFKYAQNQLSPEKLEQHTITYIDQLDTSKEAPIAQSRFLGWSFPCWRSSQYNTGQIQENLDSNPPRSRWSFCAV